MSYPAAMLLSRLVSRADPLQVVLKIWGEFHPCQGFESSSGLGGPRGMGVVKRAGEGMIGA